MLVRYALDLYPVGARMLEPWIGEPVLEPAIVSEKEQAFAVTVQPSNRINAFYGDVILQRLPCPGKLAEHVIGLVE
jgi:hypothetical protein